MILENTKLQTFIIVIVLLFSIMVNLIEHVGSITLVLLMLLGFSVCFSKEKRPTLSMQEKWVMWAFVSYCAVYLFSFGFNGILGNLQDPRIKFIDHELRFLTIVPIFFLLKKNPVPKRILWFSVIIGCIISGGYAIFDRMLISPGERVQGSYHEIAFGHICLAMAFMSIAGLNDFKKKKTAWVIAPLSAFVLGVSGAVFSGTRGAWIAFPPLLLAAFFQFRKDLGTKVWAGVIMIICIAAVFIYQMPSTGIAQRIDKTYREIRDYRSGNLKSSSFGERIEGWLAAAHIFQAHPIVGAGPGNFKPYVKEMIAQGKRSNIIARYSQPHSIYMAVMADCGIPGLASLLAVFLVPLWTVIMMIKHRDTHRDVGYAGVFLIVGFMIFGLTETIFGRNIYICYYIIMLSVILSTGAGSADPHSGEEYLMTGEK